MEVIAGFDHTTHTGPSITVSTISSPEPAPNVDIRLPDSSSVYLSHIANVSYLTALLGPCLGRGVAIG
jgi:hypothetical protein